MRSTASAAALTAFRISLAASISMILAPTASMIFSPAPGMGMAPTEVARSFKALVTWPIVSLPFRPASATAASESE